MTNKEEKLIHYVESTYKKISVVGTSNKEIKNYMDAWGHRIYIKNKDTFNLVHYIKSINYEYDELKENIVKVLRKHLEILERAGILGIYKYTFDISRRKLIMNTTTIKENKDILIITLKYFKNKNVLMADSFSAKIIEFSINDLYIFLNGIQKKLYKLVTVNNKYGDLVNEYLIFSPVTSAIITHEFFGHAFEYDNFLKIVKKVKYLHIPEYITVIDNPQLDLSGYCCFDDLGNILKSETIIKNGNINKLITSSKYNGAVRQRAGEENVITRVTNTVLLINDQMKISENDLSYLRGIQIESVYNCFLKDDFVYINADACYFRCGKQLYNIGKRTLKINIVDFFYCIEAFYGNKNNYSSIDCIKKHEKCGGIGSVSNGLILKLV